MDATKKISRIGINTVGSAWMFGFFLAIFTMIIYNVMAQNIKSTYYYQLFCSS
jgi:hypothetical protein